jgi:CBS domain-containing protein
LAVERMGEARLELLPVVSRKAVHKLEGIVTLADILESYGIGCRIRQSNSKRGAA